MEKDVIYVIESQDHIFVADTLEKAEEIADRLVMDVFGWEDTFKREYIKKDRKSLGCKDPYNRKERVYYDSDEYDNEWVANIKVCKMNFCRYDKNGKYIYDYSFGDEV